MFEDTRKVKSGFCSIGHHEGGKYPGPSGKLNKTCLMIDTCSCKHPTCHEFYDRMFEMSELERTAVDNSGYQPEHGDYSLHRPVVMPLQPILSNARLPVAPDTLESPAPGVLPPTRRAQWHETPTGRAGRGQLEDQVNRVCIGWLADESKVLCTPGWVSSEVSRAEGIKPPSAGAIDACFKRWERIGYAVIERKPTRFTRFTDAGIERGLDWLKKHPRS